MTLVLQASKTYRITRATIRGGPLARFDMIEHRDGSVWRYEGLARDNTIVAATAPGRPGEIRHFAKADFGIVVDKLAESA